MYFISKEKKLNFMLEKRLTPGVAFSGIKKHS